MSWRLLDSARRCGHGLLGGTSDPGRALERLLGLSGGRPGFSPGREGFSLPWLPGGGFGAGLPPPAEPQDAGEPGPARVDRMPGGRNVRERIRATRRIELLKEAGNVLAGGLGSGVVAAVLLSGAGAGPEAVSVLSLSVCVVYLWVLGREVMTDLSRNGTDRPREGARR